MMVATTPPTTGVPTTSEDRFFDPHVRSALFTYCVGCHASPGDPAYAAFPLSGFPSDTASFTETVNRVDAANPEGSLLLQKATNAVPLQGGPVLRTSDVGYEYILNWIRQGQIRDQFVNAPRTFTRNIQPILDRQCYGCHSGGAGGYGLSGDVTANYQGFLAITDPVTPTNSRALRKNDGRIGHNGGAPWVGTSPDRAVVIQWLVDGRRFSQ